MTQDKERTAPATLEDVLNLVRLGCVQAYCPTTGDCLAGLGVEPGDEILVDFTRYPAPPRYKAKGGDGGVDICLCVDRGVPVFKVYEGCWGPFQVVSTRYKQGLNHAFFTNRILGVAVQLLGPDGTVKWKRDPSTYPTTLCTESTIHGDNVSDPQPVPLFMRPGKHIDSVHAAGGCYCRECQRGTSSGDTVDCHLYMTRMSPNGFCSCGRLREERTGK